MQKQADCNRFKAKNILPKSICIQDGKRKNQYKSYTSCFFISKYTTSCLKFIQNSKALGIQITMEVAQPQSKSSLNVLCSEYAATWRNLNSLGPGQEVESCTALIKNLITYLTLSSEYATRTYSTDLFQIWRICMLPHFSLLFLYIKHVVQSLKSCLRTLSRSIPLTI